MIIVEVKVPMMSRSYDFQIDESTRIYEIIMEMTDMICRREQCMLSGNKEHLTLWNMRTGQEISRNSTAEEAGLRTGSSLMLV